MPDWWNEATWTHSWWMALTGRPPGRRARGRDQRRNSLPMSVCRPSSSPSACCRSRAPSPLCCQATGCSTISVPARRHSRSSAAARTSRSTSFLFGCRTPSFIILVLLAVTLAVVLKMTSWGRHVFAIGGNEQAANLTGVPVNRVKVQAYIICSLSAALAAILSVGWSGSANNSLGQSYELLAIASAVIGGANLMGGEGGAYGAFIGSALIFVIRIRCSWPASISNWQVCLSAASSFSRSCSSAFAARDARDPIRGRPCVWKT